MSEETNIERVLRRWNDDNDPLGYDEALDLLMAFGLYEDEADELLFPPKKR